MYICFPGVPEARKEVSGLMSTGSREVAPVTGGEDFDVAGEVPEDAGDIFESPNVDAVDGMEGLEDVIEELDSPGYDFKVLNTFRKCLISFVQACQIQVFQMQLHVPDY